VFYIVQFLFYVVVLQTLMTNWR